MTKLKRVIATRIKEARKEAGLTQAELADELGISRSLLSELESGKSWIHIRRLAKMKEVLKRPADYFIGGGMGELSDDQIRLLEAYNSIDESLKEMAIDMVLLMARRSITKKSKKGISR